MKIGDFYETEVGSRRFLKYVKIFINVSLDILIKFLYTKEFKLIIHFCSMKSICSFSRAAEVYTTVLYNQF